MADEAVIIELHGDDNSGDVIRYTVADATAISKGTLCTINTANTAVATSVADSSFAGIASTDKEASDGAVTLGFFTKGKFDLTNATSSEIVAGDLVAISGANLIKRAIAANVISGAIIGKSLETDTGDGVIQVLVGYT